MRRDAAEYRIGTKSDSYIFAIERNAIPISLKGPSADYSTTEECALDKKLLIIPARKKLIAPDEIEFYRANWSRLRWFLYLFFWFSWIFSVIFAVLLAASHPKCVISVREWWKDSVIYEIWTLSYKDSDGNGVGDLGGIKTRLENLRKLGVGAIFLRPIIKVEKSGTGVIGHAELSSQIGSMADFDALVRAAHDKDLRIIIDFPLVVTSIAHPWFDRSALASRPENTKFVDFYYWRRGIPNSEYISAYKDSTLKYFHVKSRPDLPVLAWRNAGNVSDSIKAAFSFWIGKGVDGFHFTSIDYLHRSPDGRQPDWEQIAKILQTVRAHVQSEIAASGRQNEIFLFTSHEHLSERTKRLLTRDSRAVDAVVHTEMRKLAIGNKICSKLEASIAECANEIIADLLLFHQQSGSDNGNWPIWSFGSPFCPRLVQRVGSRAVGELLVLLELILPGTPLIYFGEEIGRQDAPIQQNCNKAKQNSWITPRIPGKINSSNGTKMEEDFGMSDDLVRNFRRVVRLRKHSKTLANGQTYITKPIEHQSFALCRYLQREEEEEEDMNGTTPDNSIYGEVMIYAANFGPIDQIVTLADLPPFHVQRNNPFKKGKVVARSINARSNFRINSFVDLRQREIRLGPVQAVIIQSSANFY